MRRGIGIASLTAALAACAAPAPPVPVVGAPSDVAQLAGEWEGQYSSVETGRSGSIFFHIVPGTDSSHGDVLMDPAVIGLRRAAGDPAALGQPAVRPGQAISITFVRVAGGRVSGRLDPYTDPACNCPLYTTFEGALTGDTLQGTYSSHHETGGYTQHGEWRVVRKKA
jgi:hypothetical protein